MGIRTIIIAMAAFVLSACATVYEAENFDEYQTAHKTVAILPFKVIVGNDSYTHRVNKDLAKKQLKVEGKMLQSRMYARFKKNAQDDAYTVDFQNVETTNQILFDNKIDQDSIEDMTKKQIGDMLGVDAVLTGRVFRRSPSDQTEALILGAIVGVPYQNEVQAFMTVHDTASGELVWSYDHDANGGVLRNTYSLAKSLIKGSAKKFPYKKK